MKLKFSIIILILSMPLFAAEPVKQYISIMLDHIIFAGGIVAFLMGLSRIITERNRISNILFACLFFSISGILFHDYIINNKLCEYCSSVVNDDHEFSNLLTHLADQMTRQLQFLIGPLLFLYNKSILYRKKRLSKTELLHFLPVMAVYMISISIVVFLGLSGRPFSLVFEYVFSILEIAGRVSLIIYLMIIIHHFHYAEVITSKEFKKTRRLILLISVFIFLIVFMPTMIGLFISAKTHMVINVSVSFLMIYFFLFEQKFTNLAKWTGLTINRIRYERSLIKGHNTEDLRARLYDLMEIEELYRDDELTLEKLAEKLSLSRHQLSEFLNKELSCTFNSFVNKFRIDEAKRMIHSDTEYSVLRIAYDVGFNSKSSFYRFFKKETGMNPLDYKEKNSLK